MEPLIESLGDPSAHAFAKLLVLVAGKSSGHLIRLSLSWFRSGVRGWADVLCAIAFIVSFSSCGQKQMSAPNSETPATLNEQQISALVSRKIFFGHQSVGNDIIQGIRDLEAGDRRLTLKIVQSRDPQSVPAPSLVEAELGQNGNPQSKIDAFTAILDKGMGTQGGAAILKFCYVDIDAATDTSAMFNVYRGAMNSLRTRYPLLKIVHVTVPLTTADPPLKLRLKRLLGKTDREEANFRRNQFNALVRQTYAGKEPIFDLAEAESTHSDGSREYFVRDGEQVFTLAPEFTTDGGHLNVAGRHQAAERFLLLLSQL